jgi:hypothetical protein
MFFAPQGRQDSAQGLNPGKDPRKAVRLERARDYLAKCVRLLPKRKRVSLLALTGTSKLATHFDSVTSLQALVER